ncbi:S1C family serine protease [Roseivirga sp. BDSF3-8]|uniref:S1C family serine protease n=1 Tax=Roseivirga sp. BDSF3-8 TaxID=3241598 RepID=UPI003531ABC0
MILLGLSPGETRIYKDKVRKRGRTLMILFLASLLLFPLVYLLFGAGWVPARPRYNRDLEMPVAMVQTAGGIGTAFLYNETELLTARHVVEDMEVGEEVTLTFSNADPPITTTARIVWKDPDTSPPGDINYYLNDVARLELIQPTDLPEDFPRLYLGDSDGITARTPVVLIGYPDGNSSTTTGTISNEEAMGADIFQLDVSAYPGNSGGPLITEDTEEVIGILIAGRTEEFQGINFAIKVNNID